jgi:hypothetical protein
VCLYDAAGQRRHFHDGLREKRRRLGFLRLARNSCEHLPVLPLRCRTFIQEEGDSTIVPLFSSTKQRRTSIAVGVIHLRARIEQQPQQLHVSARRRFMKGNHAATIS